MGDDLSNVLIMKITSQENVSLHDSLFTNRENYYKWAPFFPEFIKIHTTRIGRVAGIMTPNMVNIDEELNGEFIKWLQGKGIKL